MKLKNILFFSAALAGCTSSLTASFANINYVSLIKEGGAMFLGEDGAAADSVALGFFTADSVSADLTAWTAINTNSSSRFGGHFSDSISNFDTTAANGLTPYLLITDGSLSGLVTLSGWDQYSGQPNGTTPTELDYEIGADNTSAHLTTFAGAGTQLILTDGQGTDFSGGFSGTGVSVQLSPVPEPSTYAMLSGLFVLGFVALGRRR